MTRRQPSHPARVTLEAVSAALARIEGERYRERSPEVLERLAGDAAVAQRLAGALEAADTQPAPAMTEEALSESRELVAKHRRTVQQRLRRIARPKNKPNAPDGIHEERLNMAYSRQRTTLPMTLLPTIMGAVIDDLHAARKGEKPDEPALRKTRLDRALDHDETGSLRWALSLYVCDLLLTQESPQKAEGAPRVYRSGTPFSASQQAALGRLAYARARLVPRDRSTLEQFSVSMGALHPPLQPISMAQLGRGLRGLPDDRICEGVALERILCVAERLSAIYRTMP
jgi:hypothetical protein